MTPYLLDTNICIYSMKVQPTAAHERFLLARGQMAVSAITLAELELGIARSSRPDRNRLALDALLEDLAILDFDRDAARAYGIVKAALLSAGTPIGPIDTLIAAHAVSAGLTLVTNNRREFDRVPGLTVENWA